MTQRNRKTESEVVKDAANAGAPIEGATAMDRFKLLARRLLNVPYGDLKAERRQYREGKRRAKRGYPSDPSGSSNRIKK
jgi:hypothetical protein